MIKPRFAFQPTSEQTARGIILLTAGFAGAGFAQLTLMQALKQPGFWDIENWLTNLGRNTSPLPGLLFYLLAGWLFIRGLGYLEVAPTRLQISLSAHEPASPRFGFWITSLGLAGFLAYSAATPTANDYGPALSLAWAVNLTLLIISAVVEIRWQPPSSETARGWLRAHGLELLGVMLIVLLAFMLRFRNIELQPYSFINDEGEMGTNGACVIQGLCNNLFAMGWAGQPMLAFVPTGISVALLGHTATAVRLVSVITGTLAVLAVYLFTKEVFGQREAWMAMVLLAVLPVHVHFSRLGVDNIVDSLSTTVILWLVFRGVKRGSEVSFLSAGVLGGLCLYTYPGTRLAPMLGLGALGYMTLQTRGFLKAQLRNILIFVIALSIVAAPIAGFFLANPNFFFARMTSEGIFQNQAFENALNSGNSVVSILTNQFMRSSLVFILTPAPYNFYNSPQGYLTPLAAIFFMLGLAYTIWRIKEERYLVLFVWFWAAILLGSTITGGPPSTQRMQMSMPGLAIITAIGITRSVEYLPQTGRFTRWLQILALVVFVSWVGYKDIRFYQYEYQVGHFFEDSTNEFTYETAGMIAPLHDSGRFYLLAESSVPYLSFANFNYFSPDVEKATLDMVTPESLANIPKDKDALFIATPGHLDDLKKLAGLIPGGEWREVQRRYQPSDMLYYSYKIKQNELQSFKP